MDYTDKGIRLFSNGVKSFEAGCAGFAMEAQLLSVRHPGNRHSRPLAAASQRLGIGSFCRFVIMKSFTAKRRLPEPWRIQRDARFLRRESRTANFFAALDKQ